MSRPAKANNIKVSFLCQAFLRYKHAKYSSFYLYSEPCNSAHYIKGLSWQELLGISEHPFRRLRNEYCEVYRTKSSYDAQIDPFKGKPFACYHHKLFKKTYYILNPIYSLMELKEFLEAMGVISKERVENKFNINILPLYPPRGENKVKNNPAKERKGGKSIYPILGSITDRIESYGTNKKIAQEMLRIWKEEGCGAGYISTTPWNVKAFSNAFKDSFALDLERWRLYCRKISHTHLLTGKIRSTVKLTIKGALCEHFIQHVRRGTYMFLNSPSEFKKREINRGSMYMEEDVISDNCVDLKSVLSSLMFKLSS